MEKCKIFISHISEENEIALVLKDWITDSFIDKCDVFVSSSPEDISPGQNWLEVIKTALKDANIQILLCSPKSLPRPWINFEAGFAWATEISIIPCCHSGLKIGDLPIPLNLFQALELSTDGDLRKLFNSISKKLKISKVPPIDFSTLTTEIMDALSRTTTQPGTTNLKQLVSVQLTDKHLNGLDSESQFLADEYKGIFQHFKQYVNLFKSDITNSNNRMTLQYQVDKLHDAGLVTLDDGVMGSFYELTKKGRAFIVENHLV